MKARQHLLIVGSLFLSLAAAGCGYRHGFDMPEGAKGVKTVAIDLFKNKTLYMDLETEFGLALEREINSRTDLKIVPRDRADAVISGSIDSYSRVVERKSRQDEVARQLIRVGASYQFKRLPSNGELEHVIRERKGIEWSEPNELALETEAQSRHRALDRLAREVVNDIFEPWKEEP